MTNRHYKKWKYFIFYGILLTLFGMVLAYTKTQFLGTILGGGFDPYPIPSIVYMDVKHPNQLFTPEEDIVFYKYKDEYYLPLMKYNAIETKTENIPIAIVYPIDRQQLISLSEAKNTLLFIKGNKQTMHQLCEQMQKSINVYYDIENKFIHPTEQWKTTGLCGKCNATTQRNLCFKDNLDPNFLK